MKYKEYNGPFGTLDWKNEIIPTLKEYLSPKDFNQLEADDQLQEGKVHMNAMNQGYYLYESIMIRLNNGEQPEDIKKDIHWIPITPEY